ncbi:MAG: hypothetical protein ACRDTX_19570 [Pseudonocardiaceae bacterium]
MALRDPVVDTNVVFDHRAANDAIGALQGAAAQLEQANKQRAGQAKDAREDWSGATRVKFDQTLNPALRQAGELVVALQRAAGAISEAATEATNEQKRRLKARTQYPSGGGPH